MTDLEVPKGGRATVGRVDGDLIVGAGAEIRPEANAPISVSGTARFQGDARILGSLKAGRIEVRRGNLSVRGEVGVSGDLEARNSSVEIDGRLEAVDVDVGRRLVLKGGGRAHGIQVGGELESHATLEFDSVSVGGTVSSGGLLSGGTMRVGGHLGAERVTLRRIEVGGAVELREGSVADSIRVGGSFRSTGTLEFGRIEVGGRIELGPGAKGGAIEVGGALEALGDLTFRTIEVGGSGSIRGNGKGDRVEAGGRFAVGGGLVLAEDLEVGGVVEIGHELEARGVEVGGRLKVEGARISGELSVGGEASSRTGIRAGTARVGRRGRVTGPLIGDRVLLDKECEAGAVYGASVQVGAGARVGPIVGDRVEIARGAEVESVLYRTDLRADPSVVFASPPRKVDSLPPFPA